MSNIVVFHHNDLDGYGAAAVVYHWASDFIGTDNISGENFRFLECNYADHKVKTSRLNECGFDRINYIFIVDLSFSTVEHFEEVYAMLDIYPESKIIWIDHHEDSTNLIPVLYEDARFRKETSSARIQYEVSKDRSGAWLTWHYLVGIKYDNAGLTIPMVLVFIDDYDRWVHNYPESKILNNVFWACAEGEDLKNPRSVMWDSMLCDLGLNAMLYKGLVIADYKTNLNSEIFKNCVYVVDDFEGYKAIVLNNHGNSECFCDAYNEYPICVLWRFNGQQYTYSLYSNPKFNVNCNEIAAKYGGGGHPGAAGFATDELLPALRKGTKVN